MSQTNLMSDAWCKYNQESSIFFYQMQPHQYENTFTFGEVGINSAGGTGGSYVRPDVIDISSFLSGRDDMLSKCQPPVPDLDDLTQEPLRMQDSNNADKLLPNYTREKRSAIDLSAIDYNRWVPLDTEPQNLRFIIEDMWPQRGGLDSRNYTKLSWTPGSFQYQEGACKKILDPSWACGEYCDTVSGYTGTDPRTSQPRNVKSTMLEAFAPQLPNEPDYPFMGPHSQDVVSVGAAACGPNFYYGPNYDQKQNGACDINVDMLQGSALSLSKFPLAF